ncbi:MAG TPA: methyltransferase domain-containing protein [Micromonosporaceae bacterium]|nr:methyltransferase domain-containing protein [Micromonosporaceae bacterium]
MSNEVSIDKRGRPYHGRGGLAGVLRFFGTSPEARVRTMYDLLDRRRDRDVNRELLGFKKLWVNFGYWEPGCDDHDEASQALAEALGEAAGITAGDRVLDAGFGYAEQDIHWVRTRRPAQIAGVNISPNQVRVARQRAEEEGVADRLDLRVASATSVPFADGSFDRVVALESAVHFGTRQKFFEEAFRVLRPGGVLATADLLPRHAANGSRSVGRRLEDRVRRALIPQHNWYPRDVYAQRLAQAGFTDVEVRDVTDQVLRPHAEFARRRSGPPYNQIFNQRQMRSVRFYVRRCERHAAELDYVIAVAHKPGGGRGGGRR